MTADLVARLESAADECAKDAPLLREAVSVLRSSGEAVVDVAARLEWYEREIASAESHWIDHWQERFEGGDDVPDKEHFVALWLAERTPPAPSAPVVDDAEDRFEQYVASLIDKAPNAQKLGERLAELLDEDDFNNVNPQLLALARMEAALSGVSAPVGVEAFHKLADAMDADSLDDTLHTNWRNACDRYGNELRRILSQQPAAPSVSPAVAGDGLPELPELTGGVGLHESGQALFTGLQVQAYATAYGRQCIASSAPQGEATLSAKPLAWKEESAGWWSDGSIGFNIELNTDPDEAPENQYTATWGDGDSAHFATLEEAKAWCQDQADGWIRDYGQATPPPAPAAEQFCDGHCSALEHHPDCVRAAEQPQGEWKEAILSKLREVLGVDGSMYREVKAMLSAAPSRPVVDEGLALRVAATLGHEPKVSDRCTARVVPTPASERPPGPSNPPVWCCLKAGHEGPHRCDNGGMSLSYPFRVSDKVEFREPVTLCAKCRTKWPCPDAAVLTAAIGQQGDGNAYPS